MAKISKTISKGKNTDLNTGKIIQSKKGYRVFDEYNDLFSGKLTPVPEEFIIKKGRECLDWALNNEDALKITQFFRIQGISTITFQRWMERSPKFKELYMEAKYTIGDRRETGEITRKYSNTFCNPKAMAIYDPEWELWARKQDEIKNNQLAEVTINLQNFPKTDEVPERK